MAVLNPLSTSVGDLCAQALKEAGAVGIGQTPNAEDMNDTWARLQWMLQGWQQERYLIYHLVTRTVISTGQITPYTLGPGGQISNGALGLVTRPDRLESAFFIQYTNSPNGPIRYPLKLLPSMENYNRIALPDLQTFSLVAFYDPAYPMGQLYVYPWPNGGGIYGIGVTMRESLPTSFPSLATLITLPPVYFNAIMLNLALAIRPKFGIATAEGDVLPQAAKRSLGILRKGSTAIPELGMPAELARPGLYNIYSDQNY